MRLKIMLYTVARCNNQGDIVRRCLSLIDFGNLRVSRTIEPGNYFSIEKQFIQTGNAVFPSEDIQNVVFTDVEEVGGLTRDSSVLTVSYGYTRSARLSAIVTGISQFSPDTAPFFSSDSGFEFGPLDIVEIFEDESGDDDVRLIDISQCCWFLSCDNYVGDVDTLQNCLGVLESFIKLRTDLESIVGPLRLRLQF
jgi:hypothetical protein